MQNIKISVGICLSRVMFYYLHFKEGAAKCGPFKDDLQEGHHGILCRQILLFIIDSNNALE